MHTLSRRESCAGGVTLRLNQRIYPPFQCFKAFDRRNDPPVHLRDLIRKLIDCVLGEPGVLLQSAQPLVWGRLLIGRGHGGV